MLKQTLVGSIVEDGFPCRDKTICAPQPRRALQSALIGAELLSTSGFDCPSFEIDRPRGNHKAFDSFNPSTCASTLSWMEESLALDFPFPEVLTDGELFHVSDELDEIFSRSSYCDAALRRRSFTPPHSPSEEPLGKKRREVASTCWLAASDCCSYLWRPLDC